MSIVYFSLTTHDQKKIIKSQNSKTIGKDCQIPTKERICYRKHCSGPDDRQGRHHSGYHFQTDFEYQFKNKTRVIQNMCSRTFVNG